MATRCPRTLNRWSWSSSRRWGLRKLKREKHGYATACVQGLSESILEAELGSVQPSPKARFMGAEILRPPAFHSRSKTKYPLARGRNILAVWRRVQWWLGPCSARLPERLWGPMFKGGGLLS